MLDVWAHLGAERDEVLKRAREEAGAGGVRIHTKGPARIARGSELAVSLAIPRLEIREPDDKILWEGEMGNATFVVSVPWSARAGDYPGRVRVRSGAFELLRLDFVVQVARIAVPGVAALSTSERRYRTAFASYASEDRDDVLARVQGMQKVAPDLEVFLDVLSLRSGQDWKGAIAKVIPAKDVFYLFWSKPASRSRWVDMEWRTALTTRGLDFIDPVPLVDPSEVAPPRELAGKHFSDWVLAFMRHEHG